MSLNQANDGEPQLPEGAEVRVRLPEQNGDETIPFIEKDQTLEEERPPPKDRLNLVYLIVLLHGIGVLLPWNTFLTIANEYFIEYKLATSNGTEYRQNFFSYLGACSQIPNLLLNMLNLFIVIRGGLARRISFSLFIIAGICLFTMIMVFVDSSSWPFRFFLLTMLSVIVLNSANGVYQNSIYGLIADFPAHFTNAVILGNNLCGIAVSLLAILTLLFSKNIAWAAFLYFSVSLFTVAGCLFTFFSLPKLAFYRYYTKKARAAREKGPLALSTEGSQEQTVQSRNPGESDEEKALSLATYLQVFKEVWRQLFDVFIVFFVTLALFPSVFVKVRLYPLDRKYDLPISGELFLQIAIFLNFNFFASAGNFIANYVQWPSPKYLTYAVLPRLLFIPIFLFCNYVPATIRHYPVFITNEWVFVLLISLMSLSHGYYSSLSMMYAPKVVSESKARTVGMMSGFFLVLGITLGIMFTFFESYIFS